MASDKLRQTVQDAMDAKQDVQKVFFGYLGNADGTVIVPGKPNYVYVTLSDGMCAQAYNTVVPSIAHLPVVCGYDIKQKRSDLFRILDIRNVPRNGTTESAFYVDKHHTSHEWLNGDIGGGTDLIYVQLRQFMPLRPSPVFPYSINIGRDVQWINGSWQVVGAQTFDLSSYIPAATSGSGSIANECFAVLSMSPTSGSITITSGSVNVLGTSGMTAIPAAPAGDYPICAVRLFTGQTGIYETRVRNDLIDLRWNVFSSPATLHNNLGGLQGGIAGQYNHLTDALLAQVIAGSAVVTSLSALTDVSLSGSPLNNENLVYDNGFWMNKSKTVDNLSSQCGVTDLLTTYNFTIGSTLVHLNGLLQISGSGYDYTEGPDGDMVVFNNTTQSGDTAIVEYYKSGVTTLTGPYTISGSALPVLVKANLHGHTTESDGSLSPTDYVALYTSGSYGALAITDHDMITVQPAGITAPISGDEQSTTGGHIGSLNSDYLRGATTNLQTIINGIVAGSPGGIAILNHPKWTTGISYATMAALTGYKGIEIHNAVCEGNGKGFDIEDWDLLLTNIRRDIYGFSVDDYHTTSYQHGGKIGRIQIFSTSGSTVDVINSINNGNFVADVSNFGVTPGYPDVRANRVLLNCPGATSLRFLNQDGIQYTISGSSGEYIYQVGDLYVRTEAVGDYTEGFMAALDSNYWGVSSGSWASASGSLVQSSNTTGPHYLFLHRHLCGDYNGQADFTLTSGSPGFQAGFILNGWTNGDYWYLRVAPDTLSLWNSTGGAFTPNNAVASGSYIPTVGVPFTIKFQYTYATDNYKAKVWTTGGAEPGTWAIDYNGNSSKKNGMIGVRCRYTMAFQNLYINGFKTYYQPIPVGDWV